MFKSEPRISCVLLFFHLLVYFHLCLFSCPNTFKVGRLSVVGENMFFVGCKMSVSRLSETSQYYGCRCWCRKFCCCGCWISKTVVYECHANNKQSCCYLWYGLDKHLITVCFWNTCLVDLFGYCPSELCIGRLYLFAKLDLIFDLYLWAWLIWTILSVKFFPAHCGNLENAFEIMPTRLINQKYRMVIDSDTHL